MKSGQPVVIVKRHPGDGNLPEGTVAIIEDIKHYRGVLIGMHRVKLSDGWYDDRSVRRITG